MPQQFSRYRRADLKGIKEPLQSKETETETETETEIKAENESK